MNKRKMMAVLLLAAVLFLGLVIHNGNKVVYGISEGAYVKQTNEDFVPLVHFDMSSQPIRFVMSADERVSFAYRGTVKLKNGYAYLHVENGGQVWVFDVIDNDTIAFAEKKSDDCEIAKDGDIFIYQK